MTDFSHFAKDAAGRYVWVSRQILQEKFPAVILKDYPVKGQERVLFWLGGDGRRSLLYTTLGLGDVVPNSEFTFVQVYGAIESKVDAGRIMYRAAGIPDQWIDVGPLTPAGVKSSDPDFDEIRKAYTKDSHDGSFDKEEARALREAVNYTKFDDLGGADF